MANKSVASCLLDSGLPEAEVDFLTREIETKIKSIRALRSYDLNQPMTEAVTTAISPVIKRSIQSLEKKQASIYNQIEKEGVRREGKKKRRMAHLEREREKPGGAVSARGGSRQAPSRGRIFQKPGEKVTTPPKAKTKKEISLDKYNSFIDSLTDGEKLFATDLIIKDPDKPGVQLEKIKKKLTEREKLRTLKSKEAKDEGREPKPDGSESVSPLEGTPSEPSEKPGKPREAKKRPKGSRRDSDRRDDRDGESSPSDIPEEYGLSGEIAEDERNKEDRRGDRPTEVHPTPPRKSRDYRITEADDLTAGGAITKARQNLQAIRTLKRIESEQRDATEDEKKILVKYVGWGGLPQVFEYRYDSNESKKRSNATLRREIGGKLDKLLTEEEYREARASTQNAHYTEPTIITKMWEMIGRMGFKGGRVIEPGSGISHFRGLMPEGIFNNRNTSYTGVELDSITSRIAAALYPDSKIEQRGYEKVAYPDDYYDLAISNVPFAGDVKPYDPSKRYEKYNFVLHDFFFAKAIDQVRPGGMVAFITSRYTMDKQNAAMRRYISERADFVGAIRLPNNAFKKNAMTEVVTDIIFLRKKIPGKTTESAKEFLDELMAKYESYIANQWIKSKNIRSEETPMFINEYYINNEDMMLGKMKLEGTMYGPKQPTLVPDKRPLEQALTEAMAKLPANIYKKKAAKKKRDAKEEEKIFAPENLHEGSFVIHNGKIYTKKGNELKKYSVPSGKTGQLKGLIGLRDQVKRVLQSQYQDNKKSIPAERKKLNQFYDSFVKKYGFINLKENKNLFTNDPEKSRLLVLEHWDSDKEVAKKTQIFTEDVIVKPSRVESVSTSKEALNVVLNETGSVDMDRMVELTGFDEEQIVSDLNDILYLLPGTSNEYETSDRYLSGNVKHKLRVVKESVKEDPRLAKNLEALQEVQPEDIGAQDISTKLSAPWIVREWVSNFVQEKTRVYGRVEVRHSSELGLWSIVMPQNNRRQGSNASQGTNDYYFSDLVAYALNHGSPVKQRTIDGKKITDQVATLAAQQRIQEIQTEFRDWLFEDADRRKQAVRLYNDKYNTDIERVYDGSFLTLAGSNPTITLRSSQRNAIWRIIQEGRSLLHHVVGSGKTWTMVGAGMEMKRLGLINKPMYVVPNHMVEQFAAEALELYPGAKILTIGKDDIKENKRKLTTARITTQNWDAIIIRQSTFTKIGVTPEREAAYIQQQLDALYFALIEAKAQEQASGGRSVVKVIEKSIATKRAKLEKLGDRKSKDVHLYFEDMGIDYLFVDEAHNFKNLDFHTKMTRVSGLGKQGDVKKTQDMAIKVDYVQGLHGGKKGVTFATGTPISNTVAEMYLMLKYLTPVELSDAGLQHFDSFIGMYGEASAEYEWSIDNTGYTQRNRLRKFVNVGEMMQMYRSVADIITIKDIREILIKETGKDTFPKVKGGKPKMVEVEPSEQLLELNQTFSQLLADWKRDPQGTPDGNPLRITTMGKLAALDMRTIDEGLADDPNSKINIANENIYSIWERTKDAKSTQLVWLNSGVPNGAQYNLYQDVKDKLVAKGIPENEIKFAHDYPKDEQKQDLYKDMRLGKIRVLIGSTQKMGTGMNVQKKLIAAHHLEPDWRPSDLEQRDGRIIRHGNENAEVEIYWYSTKQSFDTFFWGTLETKAGYIGQVLKAGRTTREIEDTDKITANFAEAMAVTSGNPLVKEKIEIDAEVRKYEALKNEHEIKVFKAQDRTHIIKESRIPMSERYLGDLKKDVKKTEDLSKDKFKITIEGKEYTKRKEANAALLKLRDNLIAKGAGPVDGFRAVKFGKMAGFDIYSSFDYHGNPLMGIMSENREYDSFSTTALIDIVSALGTRVSEKWFQDRIGQVETQIKQYKEEIDSLIGPAGGKYKYEEELRTAKREQIRITEALAAAANNQAAQAGPTQETFYVRMDTGEFEERRGEDVSMEIHAMFNFYLHKETHATKDDEKYAITEANTGLSAGKGPTREQAIDTVRQRLKTEERVDKLLETIQTQIDEGKQSPWEKPTDTQYQLLNQNLHEGALANVDIDTLQENPRMAGAKITRNPDNTIEVRFKNGLGFKIEFVDTIETDSAIIKADYGQTQLLPGEKVGATYSHKNKTITITDAANIYSLEHEVMHFIEKSGLLKAWEIAVLNKYAKRAGFKQNTEGRANYVSEVLLDPDSKPSIVQSIVQSIIDFIDKIFNAIGVSTDYSVLRKVREGEVLKREAPGEYQLTPTDVDTATQYQVISPTMDAINAKFGAKPKKFSERVKEVTATIKEKKFWDKAATTIFDRLNPIKMYLGDFAYKLARNETGTQSIIAMFLRHGKLFFDPSGVLTSNERNKGFMSFIKEVGAEWDIFLKWTAARRAQNLEKEHREKWLTKDIRTLIFKEAGADKQGNHAKFEKYAKTLEAFNNNILDVAQQAGLINAKDRKKWAQEFYIPFYRLLEDKESREEFLKSPGKSQRIVHSGIKRLKGAKVKIGDLQENLMRNWFHLIHESQRNVSRFAAVKYAEQNDPNHLIIEPVKKVPKKNIWFVMRPDQKTGKLKRTWLTKKEFDKVLTYQKAGRPQSFMVHEPDVFNAMTGMNLKHFDNFVSRAFGAAKRLLTYSATFGPAFRIANLLRDTMHTALIEKSFVPFVDSWKGLLKSLREDQDYIKFAASGFAFGSSYVRADDPKSAAKFLKRISKKEGSGALDRIIDTPKKALDLWEKIGSASENAARVQLYTKLVKQGKTHLEAAFAARDLLDFTMRGESSVVGVLIQTVPFLNARMQGLYKLGRTVGKKETRANFAFRGAILTMASIFLWSLHKDDEEYKELEDWDKWSYYHFWIGSKHYRIPKPFEVGAVFSSLPVAFSDVLNDTEDGKHLMEFTTHTLRDTFSIDIPQLVKPLIEQWANKSFFTGREIVPERLQGLPAKMQKDTWTAELAILAGKLGVSPKRAEHLVRAYFSVIGMGILSGTDYLTHHTMDYPEDPTMRIGDYPLVGRFVKQKGPARHTKYQKWFYETFRELDGITRAVNDYKRKGEYEKFREYRQEHLEKIRDRKQFIATRRKVSKIRIQMDRIYRHTTMSASEKRKRINQLTQARNNHIKRLYDTIKQPTGIKETNNWNARARKDGRYKDIIY